MQRTKWTERKFTFDFPEGWIFNIIERLRGTPARLEWITATLGESKLTFQPEGKWSRKEEIGHLSDLEELHEGRINDFLVRKETLRAADMTNAKTFSAKHNQKTLNELLNEFSEKRKKFTERLGMLDDDTLYFRSMHPRLQVPMRPVDMAFFTAEHDDHHIASIRNIINGYLQ